MTEQAEHPSPNPPDTTDGELDRTLIVEQQHLGSSDDGSSSSSAVATIKAVTLCPIHHTGAANDGTITIESECYMGRRKQYAPQCRFKDSRISSTQCHFAILGEHRQQIVLTDHSTNGTFVNGTKVGKGNCVSLKHGDVVSLVAPSIGHKWAKDLPCYRVEVAYEHTNNDNADSEGEECTQSIESVTITTPSSSSSPSPSSSDNNNNSNCAAGSSSGRSVGVKRKRTDEEDDDDDDDEEGEESGQGSQEDDTKPPAAKRNRVQVGDLSLSFTQDDNDPIQEQLTCGICADIFYRPVTVIPCLHNFCAHCLTTWHFDNGQNSCPQCRTNMNAVSRNHGIANLVEAYIKEHPTKDKRTEEEKRDHDTSSRFTDEMLRLRSRDYDDNDDDDDDDEEDEDEDPVNNRRLYYAPFSNRCIECDGPSAVDGHQCMQGQSHAPCSACRRMIPLRQDLDAQRTQQCSICYSHFCNPYFSDSTCTGNASLKPLGSHQMYQIPSESLSQNAYEQEILKEYMRSKQLYPQGVFDAICQKVDSGEYTINGQRGDVQNDDENGDNSDEISSRLYCCSRCAVTIFQKLVYLYRSDIPDDDLPSHVTSRTNCWYGRECRTQSHNAHHARKLNHICENTRRQDGSSSSPLGVQNQGTSNTSANDSS